MKTIKVFAVPSHLTKTRHSGVDFARINQPMKYLNGFEYDGVKFEVDIYDIHGKQEGWESLAKRYDLVYINYVFSEWQYVAMGMFMHENGKKIIMDVDDDMWHIRPDNISYNAIMEAQGPYKLSCMLDDVDGVTTTNRYLRNIICDNTKKYPDKVKVFPNQIDLSMYNKTFPAKDTDRITLLHYGSTSHFQDLLDKEFVEGVDRILQEFPQVNIKFVGAFIGELKYRWGSRYNNEFGHEDIYSWISDKFPHFMEEADIIIAPLEDDKYNRCKSDIKFIETASAKIPGVFSDTRPYTETIEHGKTGYIAKWADDWYTSLKELILNKEKRQEIGENAYIYVQNERQIQNNITPYAEYFKRIVEG